MRAMNQKYHVVYKDGTVTVRRPWKGKDVELFSSAGNPDKGIPAMFGPHEIRQYLEKLDQPFIVVTIDVGSKANEYLGTKQSITILDEGLDVEDPETHAMSKWYVAGYYLRDEGAVYIMTEQPMNDSEYFTKLGLHVDMQNKWGNSFKVGKYLKRLYSHHRKFIQGEVVSQGTGSVILVRLTNGKLISVRYADHGALTDGMNLVSTHFMKVLGLKKVVGQGLQLTALSPKGFSKGHAIVMPDLRHDLVLFNSKKLLKGDKFTFGMDWLHSGNLFTDVQSVITFRMTDTPFLIEWTEVYHNQIFDAYLDEEKLRRMLNFYSVEFHKHTRGEHEGEFIEKEKDWALLRALRGGISHKPHPGLGRKLFHLFADNIADAVNYRIPVPPQDGGARYAIVDPTIFDVEGDPTLDGILKGNQVYCPGHIGELVFHRQPNAHRGEHHIATAIGSRELQAMDAGHFMFLSKDMVAAALGKLGGGDQDDRLVYYTRPAMVEHFKLLELDPYPTVEYPVAPHVENRINRYAHRAVRTPTYNRQRLLEMLAQQQQQKVSIGYAVNAIMRDTVLTDQKDPLLDNMVSDMPKSHKVNSAIQWLMNREAYKLRGVTSRLEIVIDSVKKEGSDIRSIGEDIREDNATFEVVPLFMTKYNKHGHSRVPMSRQNETYPVIARCKIDDVQDSLAERKRDLEDMITEISYQLLQPLPMEILSYPFIMGSEHLGLAIRSYYHTQRENLKKEIEEDPIKAYLKIDAELYHRFKDHPMIVDGMLHVYSMIYSKPQPEAKLDENGRPKGFGDGILWGPMMSGFTIKGLEAAGLAGRYEIAELDPEFKHLKHETVDVIIDRGFITEVRTHKVVGTINESANGMTIMEKGLVKVPAFFTRPYEPRLRMVNLNVVNGMESRHASPVELAEWLSHGKKQEKVELVPYTFINKLDEPEHAVRVMLDGKEFGHITRKDNTWVTMKREGWLSVGSSLKTVTVNTHEE